LICKLEEVYDRYDLNYMWVASYIEIISGPRHNFPKGSLTGYFHRSREVWKTNWLHVLFWIVKGRLDSWAKGTAVAARLPKAPIWDLPHRAGHHQLTLVWQKATILCLCDEHHFRCQIAEIVGCTVANEKGEAYG
jgi:hypothetical protein